MPRSRDFLDRFRPAGTPGAAAKTGVPADRVAELSAELEPILALLADAEREVDAIRAEAMRLSEGVRHQADERARDLVATARRDAEAERSDAAASVRKWAETETAETLAAAERDAAEVRRRGAELMPAYVDRVVAAVRAAVEAVAPAESEDTGP